MYPRDTQPLPRRRPDLRLSIAVQHHPSRTLPDELRRFDVVADPDPDGPISAIRTYIECLRSTPDDCTHRLVLQDDVRLTNEFHTKVELALVERPGHLVALFVPALGLTGRWFKDAAKRGDRWCQLPTSVNWRPVVALSWPRGLAQEFVPYADEYVAERTRRKREMVVADDPVVGAFCRERKLHVWATVPCLVEHPDEGSSLVKRRVYKGTNPARKAAVFVE